MECALNSQFQGLGLAHFPFWSEYFVISRNSYRKRRCGRSVTMIAVPPKLLDIVSILLWRNAMMEGDRISACRICFNSEENLAFKIV